jgi:hypothetical protein
MVQGTYRLVLVCDGNRKHDAYNDREQFIGTDRADAVRQARAAGWGVNKTHCLCPRCWQAQADIVARPERGLSGAMVREMREA